MDARADEISAKIQMIHNWLRNSDREVVLFLGAGMGREAKPPLPLASDVSCAMAAHLGLNDPEGVSRRFSMDEIAEWFEHECSWTELCDFLAAQIADARRQAGEAYLTAGRLPFAQYVTTNYDTVLERAIGQEQQVILSPFNDLRTSGVKHIFKIHGTIGKRDKASLIVTTSQYEKLLYDGSGQLESQLRTWLQNAHLVFVGFNLKGPEFLRIYALARNELAKRDGDLPRHIAVYPGSHKLERDFWHRRGISIVDLDAKGFFRALDSYFTPTETEAELIRKIKALTGNPPAPDLILQETTRSGGDKLQALKYILIREQLKQNATPGGAK